MVLTICGQQVANTAQNLTASCDLEVLPTEFGQLTQLTWLDLSSNILKVLPTELGLLTQLTWLDLTSNRLKVLPTEFGQLTQLTWLDLTSKRFMVFLRSGRLDGLVLPTEFGQLTQLTWLDFKANSIQVLPTEFGQLTQLTRLDLNSNILKVLPTELGLLTQLTWLDLTSNRLKVLPTEFGQLTQLTKLDLGSDRLKVLPTEFGQLSRLTVLDLSWNRLKALPTEFGQLTQLTWLQLQQNNLEVLPAEFEQLTQLASLNLNTNYLEALPTEFSRLTELSTLDLAQNGLEALPTEFGRLTKLASLNYRSNEEAAIKTLGQLPTEFGQLTELTSLNLNTNGVKTLPTEFGQLTQLRVLDVDSNSLEALPTAFGQLTQLIELSLQWNFVKVLPTEFGQLTQLTMLILLTNSLEALPTEFGQLTQLTMLDLGWNRLKALPTEFGQLTQLTWVFLQHNNLEALPTEFGQLTQLTRLDLSSNRLKVLPTEFGRLTQLTWLQLQQNRLNTLPFPPINLTVTFVSSAKIDLIWEQPMVPTTAGEYRARVSSGGVKETYISFSGQTVVGINLLQTFPTVATSQVKFTIQVRAEFEGGYGSPYSKPLNVTTCPASMQREDTNDIEACYALAGFYRNRLGSARRCTDLARVLPPGALGQCLQARLGIENLSIQERFWRASLSSEDIRLCPAVQFCKQRLSNLSFASPDRYCADYHTGTYCSDCLENYVLGAEGCTFCTKEARESTERLVLVVCTLLLLFALLYVYVLYSAGCFNLKKKVRCRHGSRRRQKSGQMRRCNGGCKKLSTKVLIWTKVRILFGYFQVLSSYRRTFLKQTLAESSDLLGMMALVSNVDVTWLVGNAAFRCVYDYDHYDLLLAATLGPIALAVLLFACTTGTAYCFVQNLLKVVREHTESALLLMLFLIYPYVSQTVFGTFWCESFPDADRRFNLTTSALRADYRLSCEYKMDSQRLSFMIYAGVMVAVYPVGVVVLYSWVLYAHKDRVMAFGNDATGKEKTEKLRKVSFLIKPYKVERFWFEAYELIRKLMQTSLVGFLAGLPVERELPGYLASISLSLTVVFVVGLMHLQPYKHRSDFAFALMSLLLLLPASLYSLLDPYARHEGISSSGLEALVITELCGFALFMVFEIRRVKKGGSSCVNRCLKREGGSVQTQEVDDSGDGDEPEVVTTMKKRIVELEGSLEFFKAENERLRDEKVSLIQRPDDDSKETLIQPV